MYYGNIDIEILRKLYIIIKHYSRNIINFEIQTFF